MNITIMNHVIICNHAHFKEGTERLSDLPQATQLVMAAMKVTLRQTVPSLNFKSQ